MLGRCSGVRMVEKRTRVRVSPAVRVPMILVAVLITGFGAMRAQSVSIPTINAGASFYDAAAARVMVKGRNFQPGAAVDLNNELGRISHGAVRVKGSKKIFVSV